MYSIVLRPKADRRLKAGHPWVYSNEVDSQQSPLTQWPAGSLVQVLSADGKNLGSGLLSPNSLICVRLLSRKPIESLSKRFFKQRFLKAQALRQALYEHGCYRLVYGDSDGLPGLVVDAFGDYYVVQINSAAMNAHQSLIIDGLLAATQAKGILLKNDSKMLALEGMSEQVEVVHGSVERHLPLYENNVRFDAPVFDGQKTGWFYDHRDNRAALRPLVDGARVLDVCSYIGGWGVQAAAFGAAEVVCLDASASALAGVMRNAELNGLHKQVATLQGDAFERMKELAEGGERFDVVVLDPPAFIPRKKDQAAGERAYAKMNQLGLRLVKPGGWLVAGSCSMHLSQGRFVDLLQAGARQIDRSLQLVRLGHQGGDHPIHPAVPETQYIKCATLKVDMSW